VAIVLGKKTEGDGGHRVVGPRFVQATEEMAALLKKVK
jgi:hypothetical protein